MHRKDALKPIEAFLRRIQHTSVPVRGATSVTAIARVQRCALKALAVSLRGGLAAAGASSLSMPGDAARRSRRLQPRRRSVPCQYLNLPEEGLDAHPLTGHLATEQRLHITRGIDESASWVERVDSQPAKCWDITVTFADGQFSAVDRQCVPQEQKISPTIFWPCEVGYVELGPGPLFEGNAAPRKREKEPVAGRDRSLEYTLYYRFVLRDDRESVLCQLAQVGVDAGEYNHVGRRRQASQ